MQRYWSLLFLLLALLIAWVYSPEFLPSQLAQFKMLVLSYSDINLVSLGLLCIGFVALGGPRQAIAVLYGVQYGFLDGAIVSTCIALIGSLLTFLLTRHLFTNFVANRWPEKVIAGQDLFARFGWRGILALRLFPIGSNLVTNMLSGAIRVRLKYFVLATFLGFLPQMFIFSLLGSGFIFEEQTNVMIKCFMFGIFSISVYLLYRCVDSVEKEIAL